MSFVVFVVPIFAVRPVPSVHVTASATTLRLSDTTELTLTATGEAPLRVELPKDLLEPASAAVWQIEPVGGPTLNADSTSWTQQYRLSPFLPGESLLLRFNPIKVNGVEATPDPLTFKVETSLRNATAVDARPITGIEQLPPVTTADPPLVLAGVTLLVALVSVLIAVLVVARRRKPPPVSAGEWVREQFATLRTDRQNGRVTEPAFVERLAAAFREYLSRRFGLNSEKTTTAELLAEADAGGVWDADAREDVADLLADCDEVKFAGQVPTTADCDEFTDLAGELVERWEKANGAT